MTLSNETTARFHEIHAAGLSAANAAAVAQDAKLGNESTRGLDCGFAWVDINPATSPYVRWLSSKAKEVGIRHFGRKGTYRGWQLWGSSLHGSNTQSISVHEAAARAYVDQVRAELGRMNMAPEMSVGSRLD